MRLNFYKAGVITLLLLIAGCAGGSHVSTELGIASWYGKKFHGKLTASGEKFDMYAMTAAHPSLAFGTRVRVINQENGRKVIVRINDRGPFKRGRIIDLSYAAARKLGFVEVGLVKVQLEILQ